MSDTWTDLGTPLKSPYPAKSEFSSIADKAFGRGQWRMTGDFRTDAREGQLRAQGAGTVAPGHTSRHSEGDANAPGAYDIVVNGMKPAQVAAKLKAAGWRGSDLPEGGHLHTNAPEQWTDLGTSAGAGAQAPKKTATAPGMGVGPTPTGQELGKAIDRTLKPSSDFETNVRGRAHGDLQAMREYGRGAGADPLYPVKHPLKTLGAIGGAADLAVTPVEGGITALANAESRNPQGLPARVDRAAGLSSNISPDEARRAGDIAGLAVPIPGQAKVAKGAGEAAKVASEGERAFQTGAKAATAKAEKLYGAWLGTLKRYGFEPTPGMAKGRAARVAEKGKEADSAAQKFYVAQADRAEDSFQRAKFNYDLEPLGEGFKYRQAGPVGHKGVDDVYRTISGEFDKILPKVKLQRDAKLDGDLGKIEGKVEHLQNDETRRVFNAIDHDVRQQLGRSGGNATIDGKAFKQIESDITKDAKAFRVKGQWREADLLNDYLGAMRSAMERHSSPEVAARLKQVNNAYARWSKTASAAARKPDALGKFTTSDLLHVFEQEDVSGGRSYARGKTPGQSFAKRAHDVMHPGPKLPSEGEAVPFISKHGIVTKVARAVEKPVMTAAAKRTARLARERELLKRRGLTPPSLPGQIATGVGPQLAILSGQQN